MIYLDTHVILWLYLRKGEGLSDRARQLIEYEPVILISPMVLLELDYLHEIGRTTLGSSQVFDYLRQRFGLQICRKAFIDVVRNASELSWTRDPFDRMITAQSAIDQNLTGVKPALVFVSLRRISVGYPLSSVFFRQGFFQEGFHFDFQIGFISASEISFRRQTHLQVGGDIGNQDRVLN